MNGTVASKTENGISTISFFHPQSNSLPGELLHMLAQEITLAGNDNNSNVIILKSEGDKAFCAGASFDELCSISNIEEGKKFFSGFAEVINAIRKAQKFVIVKVHGKAVGGGVGVICAADYAIASENALIKLSELAIGIGPFVIGPAVERKIGNAAFAQLSINATEWKSARWANEKGMYAGLFDSPNQLDPAVNSLAETLSKFNPEATKYFKKTLWAGTENWDTLLIDRAEISGKLVLSEFTRNAIEEFKNK